ncbi:MAG: hypothetical protein KZQ95_22195, partial [Candidatus Thiodiazotropha sp. (ex Epidulcina cf. delphinae)]|nr:hypothetical protein [Candidatus Thiodiazotropha sp. (ex Epidulcina cf. delphinae)]
RLVAQYRKNGKIQRRQRTVAGFQRYYTPQDTRLLAELDELHGAPCGAAAKKLYERMYQVHGDARFEALSHISVSQLYNLRHSSGYQRQRRHFDKTRPTHAQIGERRKPNPQGQPGYLRVEVLPRHIWTPQKSQYKIFISFTLLPKRSQLREKRSLTTIRLLDGTFHVPSPDEI